jgi:hypothetical protein
LQRRVHLFVQNTSDGDRFVVNPIEDDILFDWTASQSGRQIVSRATGIRVSEQPVQRRIQPFGVNIMLPLSPRREGVFEDGTQVVLGIFGEVEPTV